MLSQGYLSKSCRLGMPSPISETNPLLHWCVQHAVLNITNHYQCLIQLPIIQHTHTSMIVPQIIAMCGINLIGCNTQILLVVTHSTIYNMILGKLGNWDWAQVSTARIEGEREHGPVSHECSYIRFVVVNGDTD